MDKEQRDALYGPSMPFSDHKEGETIRFIEDGQEKTGTILHVIAPGVAFQGGTPHGVLYAVDADEGMPSFVAPGDVIS